LQYLIHECSLISLETENLNPTLAIGSEQGSKGVDAVADDVRLSAAVYSKQASHFRLKPKVPITNLSKATNIIQQRNMLKMKARVETLRVELELWLFPAGGSAAKKVIPLFPFVVI
jgi:hypothetical protein